VLPQTVSEGSEWARDWPDVNQRKEWVHKLGNILPLTQKSNSQAQNFDFTRKKEAYFGGKNGVSSYALTTQVLRTPKWIPEVVVQRQAALVKVLSEKWLLD
jgi:hypothetical protein